MSRVVGLDLSITATGICNAIGNCSTIGGDAKVGDERLTLIADAVLDHAWSGAKVDLVVIEDLPTHAHGAGVTGMVHGAVRYNLIHECRPYLLVPPATLKKFATGKGNCDKTAMALAAFKRSGREFADSDQCDAWWLRALGLQLLGEPLFELPADQVAALKNLKIPGGSREFV